MHTEDFDLQADQEFESAIRSKVPNATSELIGAFRVAGQVHPLKTMFVLYQLDQAEINQQEAIGSLAEIAGGEMDPLLEMEGP